MCSSREAIEAAFHDLDAALDDVAALSYDALTAIEKKDLLARLEVHRRRLPSAEHPLINQLAAEAAPEALGGEAMTLARQIFAESLVVVNLAVENNPDGAVFIGDRLMASGEVDDAQSPHTDRATAIDMETFVVGPAMDDLVAHRLDAGGRSQATTLPIAGNSAHSGRNSPSLKCNWTESVR